MEIDENNSNGDGSPFVIHIFNNNDRLYTYIVVLTVSIIRLFGTSTRIVCNQIVFRRLLLLG